jgi:hypothetical protein
MSQAKQDIGTVRRKVDELFKAVAFELSAACSTKEEIRQEMHKAAERWSQKQSGTS